MAKINHPFLLKLEYSFECLNYLGFAMEYCAGGELFYHIHKKGRLLEEEAKFYFGEILMGLDYLHKK